ncbi:MAG: tRNA (adenosine(37)-N6)-threonylcarbamoyltransferase complex transferase subunit TsaD [Vicingaceae bacterium]
MNNSDACILAIESSCDDTSAALLKGHRVLSNVIANQLVHQKYGGVIPELASRSHQKNILPVVETALKDAHTDISEVDAIAYTQGPGLPGSLIVGSAFSKSLSMALNVPLIEVNHMQAHILAHFIEGVHQEPPAFPFICLTVSGGHTQMVLVKSHFDMKIIGSTIDDAAGEAFDKIAKLLGLDYPGGPLVDKLAQEGDASRFEFSKAKVDGYNYSFSGLKTSVLYFLKKSIEEDHLFVEKNRSDLCASVQANIVEVLMQKLEKASFDHDIDNIAMAGGVSANSGLRKALLQRQETLNWKTYVPPIAYCTDNAAMIGITGHFKFIEASFSGLGSIPSARLKF